MSALPKVVLVGRMNVGKSTLFNRLSVNVKSITLDYEGVTRDFLSDVVSWLGVDFELIDSGGISLRPSQDALTERVRKIGLSLVEQADLVVFVVDGKVGVTQEDVELNQHILKTKKKVMLVINKADAHQAQDQLYEFYQLGHEPLFPISALHGTGISEVLEAIVEAVKHIKPKKEEKSSAHRIAILGKPNVGKSSLMNILLDRDRSIVSDVAGTTREAITEPIQFYKETLQLTDTPGIRRKKGVKETLETMMVKTAFRAVENASVVLLMVDGTEGKLSDQELKLAFYVFEKQHKALIILINKDDIMEQDDNLDLAVNLDFYKFFVKKIPMLSISCKTGKNIGKILPLVEKVVNRYTTKFTDEELTTVFKDALRRHPLYRQGHMLYVYKAKQVKTGPITILLFVNNPIWFDDSHFSYLEKALRAHAELKGVPVKFLTRKK